MKQYHYVVGILCFLWGLCCTDPAMAVSGAPESETDLTEDILFEDIESVYSASKYDQKVTEAPARISIVTAEEIQRYGYRTLADLLNSLPDFYIYNDRNYGLTGVRGFSIVGDYDTKILQLVDGHRVNDNIYDSAVTDRNFVLDLDLIDRVEVIRGPSSSLYGSSAFFGVINVITKRGRDFQGLEVSGSAASLAGYQGRLSYGERFDNGFEVLVSGTYFDSDGNDRLYYAAFDDPATNNGYAEHADDENVQNLFARISYNDFTLEGAYVDRDKGVPTASYETVFNDPRTRTSERHSYLDLKYQRLLDNAVDVTARLYYDHYQYKGDWAYDYSEEGNLSDIETYHDTADGKWWGTELLMTRSFFEKHKLTVGAEYRDSISQNQKDFDLYEIYLDDDRDDYTWALYLQDELRIIDNLILNFGVRYDYFATAGSSSNPRVALIYSPFVSTNLKFVYGSAFRAPNAYERYYHDGNLTQKQPDDLNSENIETFEFVFEQEINPNIRAVASIYHNKMEDLITLNLDPNDDLLFFDNLGEAEATGGDIQLEGRWKSGWSGSISYSYQNAENKTTGERLVNSPLNMFKCTVMIPLLGENLMAGFDGQYESGRKTLNDNKTDDIFLTNVTVLSRDLIKGLTLSASVYNLFDQEYALPASAEHAQDSIDQDGRTFRIKLDYAF